jgi:CDP-diacylglycerol--serine O-phosphatidyltransferase
MANSSEFSIIKYIPNAVTAINLVLGCLGIIYAFQGSLALAGYLIFLAAIADFADGFLARMLNAKSEIGKQLDSLADLVSFGVLPSAILYVLLQDLCEPLGGVYMNIPFISIAIVVFSALRLAKFNVDTGQETHFRGLPTPANALFIASLPLLSMYAKNWNFNPITVQSLFIFIVFSCILLVSGLPLLSLKFTNFNFKENIFRYLLLLIAFIGIITIGVISIPLIIIIYILLSIVNFIINRP